MNPRIAVWIPLFAAPIIWFASFLAAFAVAPVSCMQQSNALLWCISLLALALVATSGFIAWRQWREQPTWLALAGTALSAGFLLVIAAQAIPGLVIPGCQ